MSLLLLGAGPVTDAAGGGGDFGPELVSNGGFDSGDDWSLGGSGPPTISGGALRGAGTSEGSAFQPVAITAGKIYRLSYTIVSITTGFVDIEVGLNVSSQRSAAGDYVEYIVAGAADSNIGVALPSFTDAVVDNVSLKEVLVQDDYSAEWWPQPAFNASTGLTIVQCSVTGGKLQIAAPGLTWRARIASNPAALVANDVFVYSIDVEATDGASSINFAVGGAQVQLGTTAGTKAGKVRTPATNQFIQITEAGDVTATIDNVSIKKVNLPPL